MKRHARRNRNRTKYAAAMATLLDMISPAGGTFSLANKGIIANAPNVRNKAEPANEKNISCMGCFFITLHSAQITVAELPDNPPCEIRASVIRLYG